MTDYLKLILAHIPEYFMDLLEVTANPKESIPSRCGPGKKAVNDAAIFLGITIVLILLLILPGTRPKEIWLFTLPLSLPARRQCF